METAEIRRAFLDFFRERGHHVVPSSSLIPDDPTLLLTAAGMVQFKPYFLGRKVPGYPRAVSVQKCARTTDIEVVGQTARHLTFFEMLGNFSFGDYYKSDACRWAWDLVTQAFGLDPGRLWVTVFQTDDEAFEVWRDEVGLPADRIIRRGAEDNFWSMGVAGPCGPCSEIFYDRGPRYGEVEGFQDGDRIMEIWNLVFMQNLRDDEGNILGDLPNKSIDTGSGLERVAMVLQDVEDAFHIDVMRTVLEQAESLTGHHFDEDPKIDVSLRIIADHARAAAFLIADGVFPSNEERGYVLRRLMRRAVRHARILGSELPVLEPMVRIVIDVMGEAYPELVSGRAFVEQTAAQEEEHFSRTLRQGLTLLEQEVTGAAGGSRLAGSVAFRLHDTFGFPVDLTVEIAAEAGLDVDRREFDNLMEQQRERARRGRKEGAGGGAAEEALAAVRAEHGPTQFLGYERDEADAVVLALARGGEPAQAAGAGDEIEIVLDATPFYAEAGGQVGDSGRIEVDGAIIEIADTQHRLGDLTVHLGRVVSGEIHTGSGARAAIDVERRAAIMRTHTATHVVHWTLRNTLGPHARQAGSLVGAGRLRFDFPHTSQVSRDVLHEVEERANALLLDDGGVRAYETTMEYAKSVGAMALFGEKYGDIVRIVEVGDYSVELCGGTHVARTASVGPILLLGEASIGANLRRIEALTGADAIAAFRRDRSLLEHIAGLVRTAPAEAPEKVQRLLDDLKAASSEIEKARRGETAGRARDLAAKAERYGDVPLVVQEVLNLGVDGLQKLALAVREAAGRPSVVVLASAHEGRAGIVAAVTKDLAARGIAAKMLIGRAARAIGGGAGGKDEVATGGGPKPEGVGDALRIAAGEARGRLEA